MSDFLTAIFLGFIEGLTEFIPVSSTGHLVVLSNWLDFSSPNHVFEVFIQLGAIMAVVVSFRAKIFETIRGLPQDSKARSFAGNILIACVPALIAGALLHAQIKSLYTPLIIACALGIGGVAILVLEKKLTKATVKSVDDIPFKTAFFIGCFQMLALVPGVSRSGATIMGALALGLNRPAAAEFSFFVAIPIMFAAVAFDVFKNWDALLNADQWPLLITGFLVAFITAMVVLKFAMRIISRWGFAPFAWYRIVAGLVILLI